MALTLKSGGSTATTGGTDQVFTRNAETVASGRMYVDVANTDFFTREKVSVTVKAPTVDPVTGLYNKQKAELSYLQPVTREDDETIGYNTIRVYIDFYPTTSAANVAKLREYAAQMVKGVQFDATVVAGTLPD